MLKGLNLPTYNERRLFNSPRCEGSLPDIYSLSSVMERSWNKLYSQILEISWNVK